MRKYFPMIAMTCLVAISCGKKSDSNKTSTPGWAFKVGSTTYKGMMFDKAMLNTIKQYNDTYILSMLGFETSNSDRVFNIVIALADTTFSVKNYQSGITTSDHLTSFYFTHGVGGNDIYKSSNVAGEAVLNYKIESFDPSTNSPVFTFNGAVLDENGKVVPLTDGKVSCIVEKM